MTSKQLSLDDDAMSLPEPIEGVPEKSSRVPEKSRNAVQPGKTFDGFEDDENFAGFKGENIADANDDFTDATEEFADASEGFADVDYSDADFHGLKNRTLLGPDGNSTNGFRVGSSTQQTEGRS